MAFTTQPRKPWGKVILKIPIVKAVQKKNCVLKTIIIKVNVPRLLFFACTFWGLTKLKIFGCRLVNPNLMMISLEGVTLLREVKNYHDPNDHLLHSNGNNICHVSWCQHHTPSLTPTCTTSQLLWLTTHPSTPPATHSAPSNSGQLLSLVTHQLLNFFFWHG